MRVRVRVGVRVTVGIGVRLAVGVGVGVGIATTIDAVRVGAETAALGKGVEEPPLHDVK